MMLTFLLWKATQITTLFLLSYEACLHATLKIISLTSLKMKMEFMLFKYALTLVSCRIEQIVCTTHINVNPNRDSPNGYPTVTPTELQPVTLAH